ncbi:MAG: pgk, phosphoglycerate kinase [Candidatus Saccharibacteria bacterium]|nr:pgk, phosphoglycerate kinase [Candidatus Saccharibacteria bacterium]
MGTVTFFKLTIRDVPIAGKTVLVRVDYNVPVDKETGKIDDDFRIRASLPTLQYLLEHHCKVVVMSHLGRPEGREEKFSLTPVAERLQELLGVPVQFVDDCIGDKVVQAIRKAAPGTIVLLENLRFYKEEEADDHEFAKKIATSTGARYFVQDGFGVVHRAHASTHAITLCIPSVSGLLLEKEYVTITNAMRAPQRPLTAILGGAKISDKIAIIEEFVKVADKIIIGGAMANTFLAYKGIPMGKSILEDNQDQELDRIYAAAKEKVGEAEVDNFIVLPTDVAVAKSPTPEAERRVVDIHNIEADDEALDIGDASIDHMISSLQGVETVIWNGTLGYAEIPAFAHGSARLALELATHKNITSIIGGGDTADFVLKWGGDGGNGFTHVSTGGGASLELMSGEKLPGIESLLDAPK